MLPLLSSGSYSSFHAPLCFSYSLQELFIFPGMCKYRTSLFMLFFYPVLVETQECWFRFSSNIAWTSPQGLLCSSFCSRKLERMPIFLLPNSHVKFPCLLSLFAHSVTFSECIWYYLFFFVTLLLCFIAEYLMRLNFIHTNCGL